MYPKKTSLLITTISAFLFLAGSTILHAQSTSPDALSLGSINFPTSVTGEAQQEFLTGVLALHSFWYPEARDHFQRARKLYPGFAMAYWGEAMTHDHPLWEQHDQEAGTKVLSELDQQIKNGNIKWSDREKAYVDAVRILYNDEMSIDERRARYSEAMNALYEKYSSDETLAFSALASLTKPRHNYSNPDVRDVVLIASKLEQLYQRNPQHPGGMHYLIHLYDNDKFAELGLRPARDYSEVAYSSSHAIHMPSHIFRQLEMWDKVIDSNIRAYQASVEWQQATDRPINDRDFHSYRWLFEAYLEIGEYQDSCDMINELRNMVSEAENKEQITDRIESALENFKGQYEDAGESAPACGVES